MRPYRHARSAAAATAVVCATALITTSPGAAAAKDPGASKTGGKSSLEQSRDFRRAVTVRGIEQHLDALQAVADANGGTRASGTPGYAASRNYVVQKLRAAGYRPTVQAFPFEYFSENAPSVLQRTSPSAKDYTSADFSTMESSGSGDVTAAVVPVDTTFTATDTSTSGCETSDFAGFPTGAIALVQRGTCDFGVKAANAAAAGAAAVVVFNRGTAGNSERLDGTLGRVLTIPVLGTSFAVGQELGATGTRAHVATDTTNETRTTYNVIAETRRGNPDNVVMTGAHLDSVEAGPGINDNGSGSATVLELAEQMAKVKKPANKVRFAWWGAEEAGLLGADHYVTDLVDSNPDALGDIALYLNYDMVASPNFVPFVYDGDNSEAAEGADAGPEGSAQIETLFNRYFAARGSSTEPTAFDGRSDYGPFIAAGVPAGGLFTGAEGLKTPEEAAKYGGTAGAPYDACYHAACDDRDNINRTALDQMSDAAAHALIVLARSTRSVNGQGSGHHRGGQQGLAKRVSGATHEGHAATR